MTIKRPAVLFLTIVLMLGMILAFPMPVKAAVTQLEVGGGVAPTPSTNPTGMGWAWENSSRTLTLNSAYTGQLIIVTCDDPSNIVTIALTDDVSLDRISVNANRIIETNGHTLDINSSTERAIEATRAITIKDSSGTGTVNATSAGANGVLSVNSTLTIESGATLVAQGGNPASTVAIRTLNGTVVQTGGTLITPATTGSISGDISGPLTVDGGDVTIGGEVVGNVAVNSGDVNIGSMVNGDMAVSGGDVTIGGNISGALTMSPGIAPTGGIVEIAGSIGGSVNVTAGTLRLPSTLLITNIAPTSISTTGGEIVTLTGADLSTVSSLAVGGITTSITSQTAGTLTFVSPVLPAGPVFVQITNPSGVIATSHHILSASTPPPTPAPVAAGTSPQTGDPSSMLLWLTLVIISMGCLGALLFRKRIHS